MSKNLSWRGRALKTAVKYTSVLFFILSAHILFSLPYPDDFFSKAFSETGLPILILDSETGTITGSNKAAQKFYGYPQQQLEGMLIDEINILPPDILAQERDAVRNERRNYFVFQHLLSNGDVRTVEVYSRPVKTGGKTMLFSVINDITDKENLRKKLARTLEIHSSAEHLAQLGHWELDVRSLTIDASEGARVLYGFDRLPVTLEEVRVTALPEYRELLDKSLKGLVTGNEPYDVTFKIKRRSDNAILTIRSVANYYPETGRVFGILLNMTDFTARAELLKKRTTMFFIILGIILLLQLFVIMAAYKSIIRRKRAEVEIRKRENLLGRIFDILPVGLWIADKNGKLNYGNQAGIKIWGADKKAGIDEYGLFRAKRLPSREEIKSEDWALYHTINEGVTIKDELLEIEGFDGVKRIILNHTAPVIDEEGKIDGAIIVNQDITEVKKLEDERIKFERQIQQTQKLESLGVLAGGIAHDFNNILMAVLGHSELALDELSPMSPARRSIKEIETAARRAAELCRQMLAYSGKATFFLEKVDLRGMIEEMVHLLQTSISKKAILNLDLEKGLPPIMADPGQIRQIIMNLIINASDAIGQRSGVITISLGAVKCDADYLSRTDLFKELAPGYYVYFEVTDTGCGMDRETLEHIFEPFFTTKFAGRGLGLAAVLGIVRAHKGAIKVYSEKDRGTTFKVLFPALEAGSLNGSTEPDKDIAVWKGSGTILIADDEESLRALGSSMLEHLGFKVIAAADGKEAVDLYASYPEKIDLVILDLTMPHMDGSQAFSELKRINPEVNVIIASGYNKDDVGARFAGKNLAGVLQKPYSMSKLKELLSVIFNGKAEG